MIRIDLHGGFGEKGRTSLGVSNGDTRILFDVGIKVGAAGDEYYPLIDDAKIERLDAVFISHAHEDHIGGLAWLSSRGFKGRIFMTRETLTDAPAMLAQYGDPSHLANFSLPDQQVRIFFPGDRIQLGSLAIETGRSAHVVGGVWFRISDDDRKIVYTADVVPDSNVLAMDPIPPCDLLVFDASYGDDPVSGQERAEAIRNWTGANGKASLLPVPLAGKPLELMAILPDGFAVHADMRRAIEAQILQADALLPGVAERLRRRLAAAPDWKDEDTFPECPLLTFDGMGAAGPSATAIRRADAENIPILLTGHIPPNTPASELYARGRASWIRLPTHPTLSGAIGIWETAGRPSAIGHSCDLASIDKLSHHIPTVQRSVKTGDHVIL
ncbi:MAG: MBL fold metallo-hydrolase [Phyllobacterium sp.]